MKFNPFFQEIFFVLCFKKNFISSLMSVIKDYKKRVLFLQICFNKQNSNVVI
jgi:hypothetical protein